MVKVYGPMMSLDATGTLADSVTFSKWKGRQYARERVIPSNPRSDAQIGRRAMFSFLAQQWQTLGDAEQATWQDLAEQLVASPFNAFLSTNIRNWHNFLAPSQTDPATRDDAACATPGTYSAAWEENRVKLHFVIATVNQNWGVLAFARLTADSPFDTAVGNCILALPAKTATTYDFFWTPPTVDSYSIDFRGFSIKGVLGAEWGETGAVP